jgi:peptidoglycan/LPS O-acetylase OafA/YrhL
MSAISPLGAAASLAIALGSVALLQRRSGSPAPARRFGTLDGLRGYAAFLVFVHHSTAWYFFARTGVWQPPPSRLFTHFGQSSVAVFFMITGLLFWSKLIDGRSKPIDWQRLYVSRVLRLVPLFMFLIVCLWVVALATTGFRLRVTTPRAVLDTLHWLSFTITAMPNLNLTPTPLIAGQAWSLPYEWWFYLSLPLAGALLGTRSARGWLIVGAIGASAGMWWISERGSWLIAIAFIGGILSAFAVRSPAVRTVARHPAASVVCVATLAALTRFPTAFAAAPILLLSFAFAIIAAGNTLFGVLDWPAARGLGEMGYSVYLLHGLVLYVVFALVLGTAGTAALSPFAHWLVVWACTPIVIALSFTTFRLIEAPAMERVDRANAWITESTWRRASAPASSV